MLFESEIKINFNVNFTLGVIATAVLFGEGIITVSVFQTEGGKLGLPTSPPQENLKSLTYSYKEFLY